MDFGSVGTPPGASFGSGAAIDAAAVARQLSSQTPSQAQAGAAQAAAVRLATEPEMRTVGDVQRLAGFLRSVADQVAADEAGTEGQADGGGPGANLESASVAQMMTQVEKHAEKIFRSILDFAGDDRRLLEQAKGFVAKVFDDFRHRSPEPVMARLTHERVIEMIESRLRGMADNKEVDFSA